jgi:hypothetical protein
MKINFSELEKMSYEAGRELLLHADYVQNNTAVDTKADYNINDEYYSLFDEVTGNELHTVSFVTYTKDNPGDEPTSIDEANWHWSEVQ